MITYVVRTSDGRACATDVPTLAEARVARADAVESGLLSAEIYADLGEPVPYLVLSRPDPDGASEEERTGVRLAHAERVVVADSVLLSDDGERLARRPYLAGYLAGLAQDLTGCGSVAELRAGRAHWSEAAIYHVGLHCFAGLVGLDGGGHRLDVELDAYDSGCRAGVLAPQSYRTGRPPCP